ncbi:MAG: glycosyltransferase family 1 protein [Lachnospiraceae bacterium]|nr:glycosyltransferase family 1 protein [Lachnospiraceae bacterium]
MEQRKIKIAHIVGGLHSGGVEAVIYNYFSHINMDSFEVHIISNSPSVKECEDSFRKLGFIIHVLPERKKDFVGNLKQTIKIFKENNFDILHSHMNLNSFYHTFLGALTGIKVRIAHSHLVEFPSNPVAKTVAGIKKLLNKMFANRYFACGETAGAYLFGKKNVKNGNVYILKNAIDINNFLYNEDTRNLIRTELNIGNRFCIGHVGRFTEQKNHTMLIDIFKEFHKLKPDSILILIGTGELENEIKSKVNNYKLNDSVKFLGVKNDIYKYYQAMDAFLFPSIYEGLGIVLVEAQSASLPCFSSDVVPHEAKVSELVEFYSLSMNVREWAENINNYNYQPRICMKSTILNAGYEIDSAAKELEKWYISQIKG